MYVDTDISEPSAQVIDNDDVPPTYFRHRGLFLCSNQIEIAHPYYNTPAGLVVFYRVITGILPGTSDLGQS